MQSIGINYNNIFAVFSDCKENKGNYKKRESLRVTSWIQINWRNTE